MAVTLAPGGDACSDIARVRAGSPVLGTIALEVKFSGTIAASARDVDGSDLNPGAQRRRRAKGE